MPVCYDLHSHTNASDGSLTPTELVQHATRCGVSQLAVTDHDTTAGVAEASAAAVACGIELIAGVEISVTWRRHTLHIVGLNVDPRNRSLQQGLLGLQSLRQYRGSRIAARLARRGLDVTHRVAELAGAAAPARSHFARALSEAGLVRDPQRAFRRWLAAGRPAYVSTNWAGLADAVNWIARAGGVAVLAHPARYRLTLSKRRQLLREFKQLGGRGIEVVSANNDSAQIRTMAAAAEEFELLASCGSDYHGPHQHWVTLGRLRPLPRTLAPVWTAWS